MTERPKRIQLRRSKGWRKPAGSIVVSRPSKWGNPFHGDYSRETLVRAYRAYLERDFKWFRKTGTLPWTVGFLFSYVNTSPQYVSELLEPLRGHDLCCWCPLDQPCHADILLELANR